MVGKSLSSLISGDDMSGLSQDDRKKRPRTAFTAAQIKALESEFEKNKYLSVSKRMQLSKHLKLTETQVRITVFETREHSEPGFVSDQNLVSKSPNQVEEEVH